MNKTLQEKVKQDLEKKGVLDQVRKMFREKILESIKAQENSKRGAIGVHGNKVLESKTGQICITLVQDFLQSFDLNLALSVFIPESRQEFVAGNIQILEETLGVRSEPKNPILFEVIQRAFDEDAELDDDELDVEGIDEEINSHSSMQSSREVFGESQGNSQGYDQSANSLAMNEFDYIENVRRVKL